MKILKSIISAFLSIAIVSMTATPAFAVDPGLIVDGAAVIPSFFDWVVGSLQSFGYWESSFFDKDICSSSGPTGNGRHVFEPQYTTINGKLGNYYICKNCGKSAGEVSEPAYQEQVSELPAQVYNSDGSLLLVPSHRSMFGVYYPNFTRYYFAVCEHSTNKINDDRCNSKFDCSNNSAVFFLKSGSASFSFTGFYVYFSLTTPIDGYYSTYQAPAFSGYYLDVNQQRFSFESSRLNFSNPFGSRVFYSAGQEFSPYCYYSSPSDFKYSYFSASVTPPVYKVEPFDPESGTVGETYSTDTRPTVITGDYGIVDNQGVATVIKDCTIVNETTNNYYNPATGQNYPIKDWSYHWQAGKSTLQILEITPRLPVPKGAWRACL